jgi:hypothetical protein
VTNSEPGVLRLPVMIKKIHRKQNARVVTFNVDPLFNNANGLMYIRIATMFRKHDETRNGRISKKLRLRKKIS